MTCASCKREITGEFIVLSAGGGTVDDDHSSIDPPPGYGVCAWLDVTSHSDKTSTYKKVDLESHMDWETEGWSSQGEQYFCSKRCLTNWFTEILKDLPDPQP